MNVPDGTTRERRISEPAHLAGGRREAGEERRLRHHLVYAGMSFGPFQFISRRTNRATTSTRSRTACACCAKWSKTGRHLAVAVRFSVDELMGELGLQWHDEGRGVFELVGELPDLWDLKTFGVHSSNARYSEEGYQEPYVAFARQMTSKPVGGGRAIHFARRHGVVDQAWSARSHRRGPPLHLRPLPAEKDRGGEGRRHPRVHRLQHLLLVLPRIGPDPLHPEPHHRRGVAAGLASRGDRGARFQRRRARGRSGPRGARGSEGARPARLPGHARRGGHRARRAPASRVAAARTCHLDSGAGLATGTARQASQRRGLLRQPALAGARAGVRLSPRGRRNRRALDDRALRRAFGPGARDVRRSSPDAGRHHGGRRGRLAGGAVRLRPVLHGRLPVRAAGGEGTSRCRARGPASSRSR